MHADNEKQLNDSNITGEVVVDFDSVSHAYTPEMCNTQYLL